MKNDCFFAAVDFNLVDGGTGAKLYYAGDEQVVNTALEMFLEDSRLVCETPFERTYTIGNRTVVVGIPDSEPEFQKLLEQHEISYKDISGKWEAFRIQNVSKDGNSYLFIIGSDPRGVAYGVLELSRQIGVSPWVWWADVVPEKKQDVVCTFYEHIYEKDIPEYLKVAYYQLVHYPVAASAAMNRKMLYAQKSRLYAAQNMDLVAYYAGLATEAYNEIAALDYTYNKDMSGGKWELMMDMKPRDLPVYQQPVLPQLPVIPLDNKIILPEVEALTETTGTPQEGDRMIALNASDYVNVIELEIIESLGHSGKAVRLPKAVKIHPKQPHLEYSVKAVSKGPVKIKIGTIPMHPVHGNTEVRYAIVIDKQKPLIVSTASEFLSDK